MTVVECLQYMGAINSSSLFLNLNEFESALFPRQKTNVAIKKGQQCWSIQAVKFLMHYTESTFLFRFEFLYFRKSDSTFVCFHWSLYFWHKTSLSHLFWVIKSMVRGHNDLVVQFMNLIIRHLFLKWFFFCGNPGKWNKEIWAGWQSNFLFSNRESKHKTRQWLMLLAFYLCQ